MERNVLQLNDLNVFYGNVQAIHSISLIVGKGEVVYLMGRNGSGKTTMLKCIMGLVPPHSGSIKLDGIEITGKPAFAIAKLGISYVPDDRGIFTNLTVRQNLETFSEKAESAEGWTLEAIYELFTRLKKLEGNRAGTLSGGEQEILSIARALMRNPKMLLLDEPFEGLAPLVIRELQSVFQRLSGSISILLVEQNVKPAIRLADRCYIMDRGAIKSELGKEELQSFATES